MMRIRCRRSFEMQRLPSARSSLNTKKPLTTSPQLSQQMSGSMKKSKSKSAGPWQISMLRYKNLTGSHDTARADKKLAEDNLAATVAEGAASIERLASQLRTSIEDLTKERARNEDARAKQITANEEYMKALLDGQSNTIGNLDAQIQQLEQEKKDAEEKLEALKHQHVDNYPSPAAAGIIP